MLHLLAVLAAAAIKEAMRKEGERRGVRVEESKKKKTNSFAGNQKGLQQDCTRKRKSFTVAEASPTRREGPCVLMAHARSATPQPPSQRGEMRESERARERYLYVTLYRSHTHTPPRIQRTSPNQTTARSLEARTDRLPRVPICIATVRSGANMHPGRQACLVSLSRANLLTKSYTKQKENKKKTWHTFSGSCSVHAGRILTRNSYGIRAAIIKWGEMPDATTAGRWASKQTHPSMFITSIAKK